MLINKSLIFSGSVRLQMSYRGFIVTIRLLLVNLLFDKIVCQINNSVKKHLIKCQRTTHVTAVSNHLK